MDGLDGLPQNVTRAKPAPPLPLRVAGGGKAPGVGFTAPAGFDAPPATAGLLSSEAAKAKRDLSHQRARAPTARSEGAPPPF
jgi:hypothetical protein